MAPINEPICFTLSPSRSNSVSTILSSFSLFSRSVGYQLHNFFYFSLRCYQFLLLLLNFIVAFVFLAFIFWIQKTIPNFWLELLENGLWKFPPINIWIALLPRIPPTKRTSSECKHNNPLKFHLFTHCSWLKLLLCLDQPPIGLPSMKSCNQFNNHLHAKSSITTT